MLAKVYDSNKFDENTATYSQLLMDTSFVRMFAMQRIKSDKGRLTEIYF